MDTYQTFKGLFFSCLYFAYELKIPLRSNSIQPSQHVKGHCSQMTAVERFLCKLPLFLPVIEDVTFDCLYNTSARCCSCQKRKSLLPIPNCNSLYNYLVIHLLLIVQDTEKRRKCVAH